MFITDITQDDDPPPVARSRSLYRCRAHPDQAVTWRGRGCPSCPMRTTKAARRKAKKAEADEPEWWSQ